MSASAKITASINYKQVKEGTPGQATTQDVGNLSVSSALSSGVAAGQVDSTYSAQLAPVALATSSIDLAALTDAFGAALALTKVKAIQFVNNGIANVDIDTSAIGGWVDAFGATIIPLPAGATLLLVDAGAGYDVTLGGISIVNADAVEAADVQISIAGLA